MALQNTKTERSSTRKKPLPPLRNFAAIDFETANRHPSSVCSVGVVLVREGEIREKLYRLIRPAPDWYSAFHSSVHGLTRTDTESAETFPSVWTEIAARISGLPLVAHFSPFDESCLRAAHQHYGLAYPDYLFYCTCRAARRAFPDLPNHKLPTVAARCGIQFHRHHHALTDAEACALVALATL
ncbi:MAG: 3'-5' exonuclease [Zoogloeaceae bacterium]|nr:3'-5' exonuclease [Zoogloeaceae bacterium]